MILIILDFLREGLGLKVPLAFEYYSTRMTLAALTSLLCTILFGPRFIKKLYEFKIGQTIRMEECPLLGKLHEKKKDTPTMGGLLILFSMLVSLFLWMDWFSPFTIILLITTVFLGFLGAYDDFLKLKHHNTKGLSGKKKMLVQVIFALGIALYLLYSHLNIEIKSLGVSHLSMMNYMSRLYIPFLKEPLFFFKGPFIILMIVFIIIVICGSSNAVNLTDGLDGLAAGNAVLVAGTLAIVAFFSNNVDLARYLNILYVEGSGEIAIYLCALAGACLGFLWYNGHPAQVFMGDTGSLSIGGIIGVSSVLIKREVLLALIGGIFVAEALSVILQVGSYKLRNKKRIFLCSPLHHHFEYKGWPETKVVLRFWIVGLFLAVIGLASLKLQ